MTQKYDHAHQQNSYASSEELGYFLERRLNELSYDLPQKGPDGFLLNNGTVNKSAHLKRMEVIS